MSILCVSPGFPLDVWRMKSVDLPTTYDHACPIATPCDVHPAVYNSSGERDRERGRTLKEGFLIRKKAVQTIRSMIVSRGCHFDAEFSTFSASIRGAPIVRQRFNFIQQGLQCEVSIHSRGHQRIQLIRQIFQFDRGLPCIRQRFN